MMLWLWLVMVVLLLMVVVTRTAAGSVSSGGVVAVGGPGHLQDRRLEEDRLLRHESRRTVQVPEEGDDDEDGARGLLQLWIVVLEILRTREGEGDEDEDELQPEGPGRSDRQEAEDAKGDEPGGEEEAEEGVDLERVGGKGVKGAKGRQEEGPETEEEAGKGAERGRAKGVAGDEFEDGGDAHHDGAVHEEGCDERRGLVHAPGTQIDESEEEGREGKGEEPKRRRVGQSPVAEVPVVRL